MTALDIGTTLLAVEAASNRGSIGHREVTIYTRRKEVDGEAAQRLTTPYSLGRIIIIKFNHKLTTQVILMGPKKKIIGEAKNVPRLSSKSRWKLPGTLKNALKAHPKWPTIGAKVWQEIAQSILGLDEKLAKSDRRYNLIHQFCKNERNRRQKRESAGNA